MFDCFNQKKPPSSKQPSLSVCYPNTTRSLKLSPGHQPDLRSFSAFCKVLRRHGRYTTSSVPTKSPLAVPVSELNMGLQRRFFVLAVNVKNACGSVRFLKECLKFMVNNSIIIILSSIHWTILRSPIHSEAANVYSYLSPNPVNVLFSLACFSLDKKTSKLSIGV